MIYIEINDNDERQVISASGFRPIRVYTTTLPKHRTAHH